MINTVAGRTVLVTGANRGIGKAIVEEFLSAGASKVYAAARKPESLQAMVAAHGDRIVPVWIDLHQAESISTAAEACKDVEIVVNNAGILNIEDPLSATAVDAMREEMEVNVYGLMRMARAFAPVLKANGGGVFIQLNSVASIKNFASFSTYSASKAAAYSVTQALRDLLSAQGTRVLSVHPGPIATDMADSAGLAEMAESAEVVPKAILAAMEAGDFHVFPDTMARQIWGAYETFANEVVDANLSEA